MRRAEQSDDFFDRYAAALLARDEQAIAGMYAVPALNLFPGHSIAVSATAETAEFFAPSWPQYEGIDTVERQVTVLAEAPGNVWAEVTWSYGGTPREHFCYQLVDVPDGYQIALLTPMGEPSG